MFDSCLSMDVRIVDTDFVRNVLPGGIFCRGFLQNQSRYCLSNSIAPEFLGLWWLLWISNWRGNDDMHKHAWTSLVSSTTWKGSRQINRRWRKMVGLGQTTPFSKGSVSNKTEEPGKQGWGQKETDRSARRLAMSSLNTVILFRFSPDWTLSKGVEPNDRRSQEPKICMSVLNPTNIHVRL